MTEDDLTLGQKIHMKRGELRSSLRLHYAVLVVGIILITLTVAAAVPAIQFIESFGNYEYRFWSQDGPTCNTDDYIGSIEDWPPTITSATAGAYEAGLLSGDNIVRINDYDIKNLGDLYAWDENLPEVKPGDYVDVIALREGEEMTFSVKTIGTESFGDMGPRIGVETPTDETVNPCANRFVPSKIDDFTANDLQTSMDWLYLQAAVGVIIGIVLFWIFFEVRKRNSKLISELDEWDNQFIDEDYVVTFSTTKPKGKTNGEKVFNMARDVFTELRTQDAGLPPLKWAGVVENSNGYKFDVFQPFGEDTDDVFAVKHFGDTVVTLKKANEACAEAKFAVKDEKVKENLGKGTLYMDRLIIIAKTFDDSIIPTMSPTDDDLDAAKLEKAIGKIDADFYVDFMEEDEKGRFNVLWVDY